MLGKGTQASLRISGEAQSRVEQFSMEAGEVSGPPSADSNLRKVEVC